MSNYLQQFIPKGVSSMANYGSSQTGAPQVTDLSSQASGTGNFFTGINPFDWNWDSLKGGIDKETGESTLGAYGGMLSGVGALGNAWVGMKQYGLAKDQLAESKRQFNQNFATQTKMTNTQLQDRQRARVASNPQAYQSVGSYMKKNGV